MIRALEEFDSVSWTQGRAIVVWYFSFPLKMTMSGIEKDVEDIARILRERARGSSYGRSNGSRRVAVGSVKFVFPFCFVPRFFFCI